MKKFYKAYSNKDSSNPNVSELWNDVDCWKQQILALLEGDCAYRHIDNDWINDMIRLQDDDGMWRLAIDDETPPTDARVDLWYWPTYMATAILMQSYITGCHMQKEMEPDRLDSLKRGLQAASTRKLSGHGIEAEFGRVEALNLYLAAGLSEFIREHRNIAPEFASMIDKVLDNIRFRLASGNVIDDFNFDFTKKWTAMLQRFDCLCGMGNQMDKNLDPEVNQLFVYGSLMQGRAAHNRLISQSGCSFLGEAILPGYRLYDLGFYPAILPADQCKSQEGDGPSMVAGELYQIQASAWSELDQYEGEGSLYDRRQVDVQQAGKTVQAWTYSYRSAIDRKLEVDLGDQPWQAERGHRLKDRYIWYAAYGSNCLKERFLCYIEGGQFRDYSKTYPGCRDHRHPLADSPFTINLAMYFGNWSPRWQGGVCFLDLEQPGRTMGRVYLITLEQLYDIQDQEGNSISWYHIIQELGEFNGIRVLTLSNSTRQKDNRPSSDYLQIVREGIVETYGVQLDEANICDYLSTNVGAQK